MVDDVFHGKAWYARVVKNTADHDGIVGRVVVSQAVTRVGMAPGHLRARHQPVEKMQVKIVENLLEIIDLASRRCDSLATPDLPHEMSLRTHVMAGNISAITRGMNRLDGLVIDLGQEDVGNRLENAARRAGQQVGDAHPQYAITETNRVVHVGEGIKFDTKLGDGRSRPQFAV